MHPVVMRDEDFVVRRMASFGTDIERSCYDPVCCMGAKRPYRVKSVSADGLWAVLMGHAVQVPTEGLQESDAEDIPSVQQKPWWSLRR
jgi:hypothetical protein